MDPANTHEAIVKMQSAIMTLQDTIDTIKTSVEFCSYRMPMNDLPNYEHREAYLALLCKKKIVVKYSSGKIWLFATSPSPLGRLTKYSKKYPFV